MDYKNINDYEQLYLIRENDDEAKDTVFHKYKPIIISIASKYYNYLKERGIDREDLIQEGQVGLYKAINAYKETEDACFYTFCIICIEREIKSYCRKYTSSKSEVLNTAYSINQSENEDIFFYENELVDDSIFNPDTYLSNNYVYCKLIQFKNSLVFKQSLVFELRCNGFKYREIAELLDISINSVDNYIHNYKPRFIKYMME